jgi:hypothetical protein
MLTLTTDYRIGGAPRRCLVDLGRALMNVPDAIRKCVAFLQLQSGTGRHFAGTVFFDLVEEAGEQFV